MSLDKMIESMKEDFGLKYVNVDVDYFDGGQHLYHIAIDLTLLKENNKATILLADSFYPKILLAEYSDRYRKSIEKDFAHEFGHIKIEKKHPKLSRVLHFLSFPCDYHLSADKKTRKWIEPLVYLIESPFVPFLLLEEALANREARKAGYGN